MRFFVLICFVMVMMCLSFEFDQNFSRISKKCYHVCNEGACEYKDCSNVKCPGGACHFIRTNSCSCDGGACVFEDSRNGTCNGGSCTFKNPLDTLKFGYCKGGGCFLNGKSHPDFSSYLSI